MRKGQNICNTIHKHMELEQNIDGTLSWSCPWLFYMSDEEFEKLFDKKEK